MSKIKLAIISLYTLPMFALADVFSLIDLGVDFFQKLIPLFIGVAILVFFWGIVKFVANAGDEKAVEDGKKMMIWGMVGIFVIVSMWGIIGFLQETLDIGNIGGVGSGPGIPTSIP